LRKKELVVKIDPVSLTRVIKRKTKRGPEFCPSCPCKKTGHGQKQVVPTH